MKNYFKRLFVPLVSVLCLFCFTGCSDNKPIYSEAVSGGSFSVRVKVSGSELRSGGTVSVTASVKDPDGNPVPNESDAVIWSCSAKGGEFTDDKCDIVNGMAQTIFKWTDESDSDNPDPSNTCTIVASYRGASGHVNDLLLISEGF